MGRCPPFFSHAASLPLVVVLPEPCKPAIRITVGGCEANLKRAVSLAQQLNQLVAHNLDHLLAGRERRHHLGAHSFGANMLDQVPHHVEVDVGFQQRHANLAQRLRNVLFGQRALAAKVLERPLQFFCKVLKHRFRFKSTVRAHF